jgi:NAD-dependent deacetylase
MLDNGLLEKAARAISTSRYTVALTGAGISVESGIPPFRGVHGIWNRYDPMTLEIDFFYQHPAESWKVIREIFYQYFGKATPNKAHLALAKLEEAGKLQAIITQNIDNLHQEAGNREVYEFHGNSKKLVCTRCGMVYHAGELALDVLPVTCLECHSLVKPDFVFFGEGIPKDAYFGSVEAVEKCDLMLVVGTTAEVMPAGQLPRLAKSNGTTLIEINPEPTQLTRTISDLFLQGMAGQVLSALTDRVLQELS